MFDKLKRLTDRYRELEESISQPDIIQDREKYNAFLKERSALQPICDKYSEYLSVIMQIKETRELLSDPLLNDEAEADLGKLTIRKEKLTEELRILLIPPDPMDSRNVILEIRAGVGGDEAALFCGDLVRMYQKYADKNELSTRLLSLSTSALGGVNEALMMINGKDAFARMKFESGVHCVKRVPITESSGRIHTSTATVAVFPEAEEIDIDINPSDIRIDVFHASGHGGQGVNTTDSAVRITHIPSGTVVTCQDERSQLENKTKAMKVLRSRLLDRLIQEDSVARAMDRKSQIRWGDRSARIRTYYFNHDYVVDHRLGMTINKVSNVLNGEISPFIDALLLAEKADKLASIQDRK